MDFAAFKTEMRGPVCVVETVTPSVHAQSVKCRVAIDRFREMENGGQVEKVVRDTTSSRQLKHSH